MKCVNNIQIPLDLLKCGFIKVIFPIGGILSTGTDKLFSVRMSAFCIGI